MNEVELMTGQEGKAGKGRCSIHSPAFPPTTGESVMDNRSRKREGKKFSWMGGEGGAGTAREGRKNCKEAKEEGFYY